MLMQLNFKTIRIYKVPVKTFGDFRAGWGGGGSKIGHYYYSILERTLAGWSWSAPHSWIT